MNPVQNLASKTPLRDVYGRVSQRASGASEVRFIDSIQRRVVAADAPKGGRRDPTYFGVRVLFKEPPEGRDCRGGGRAEVMETYLD
jgi:hypothetical protein